LRAHAHSVLQTVGIGDVWWQIVFYPLGCPHDDLLELSRWPDDITFRQRHDVVVTLLGSLPLSLQTPGIQGLWSRDRGSRNLFPVQKSNASLLENFRAVVQMDLQRFRDGFVDAAYVGST